ncbi:MAG: DUF4147 domain-containing protein [Spirochaetales bacterium]|nr:DUF4147 domain-containing protein [Spirochaetales bacterium]
MRIQNMQSLLSHGNISGRKAVLEILEAGLSASDPYANVKKLIRLDGDRLTIGNSDFEPPGSPVTGEEVIELGDIENIYVVGAGKGIQRAVKAIEETLGDRLTGGHVIDKKGHPVILEKVEVTLGAHPVPDEDCVRGCERIMALAKKLTERDLVFTCIGSGVSSLLTMPVPDVSLDDVSRVTYLMQIERGATTTDLNAIRNHLDMMKGARISRMLNPARVIHIITKPPRKYEDLMRNNHFLHTLPDYTTFRLAVDNLKKYDAWEAAPDSVRRFLEKADTRYESVKAEEFEKTPCRIFFVLPDKGPNSELPSAMRKAEELGYRPLMLTDALYHAEARHAGTYAAAVARTIERLGQPVEPPCVLFSTGEMVVTVGKSTGIGGRNQEFALSAAFGIEGSENIVIASVDTDGTDGPGSQFSKNAGGLPQCLAGGIVDGHTLAEAKKAGVDVSGELKEHNTSPALWELKNGIVASPNISLLDLTVILVAARG